MTYQNYGQLIALIGLSAVACRYLVADTVRPGMSNFYRMEYTHFSHDLGLH